MVFQFTTNYFSICRLNSLKILICLDQLMSLVKNLCFSLLDFLFYSLHDWGDDIDWWQGKLMGINTLRTKQLVLIGSLLIFWDLSQNIRMDKLFFMKETLKIGLDFWRLDPNFVNLLSFFNDLLFPQRLRLGTIIKL